MNEREYFERPLVASLRWLLVFAELAKAVAVAAVLLLGALVLVGWLFDAVPALLPEGWSLATFDLAARCIVGSLSVGVIVALLVGGVIGSLSVRLPRHGPAQLSGNVEPDRILIVALILVCIVSGLAVIAGAVLFFGGLGDGPLSVDSLAMFLISGTVLTACVLVAVWLKCSDENPESPWITGPQWLVVASHARESRGFRAPEDRVVGDFSKSSKGASRNLDKGIQVAAWIVGTPALVIAMMLYPAFPGANANMAIPAAVVATLALSLAASAFVLVFHNVLAFVRVRRTAAELCTYFRTSTSSRPSKVDTRAIMAGASNGRSVFRVIAGFSGAAAIVFSGLAASVDAPRGWPDTALLYPGASVSGFLLPAAVFALVAVAVVPIRFRSLAKDAEFRNFIREDRYHLAKLARQPAQKSL
ncbi:hypothetical protein [Arthrobacter sp. E3]|uniref:hypothetical protein n=1 Tax=Arthrobacter sp. E3 TaxID=517402 RepID=UPI001A9537AE|nr:hypothetical protein [Arthrobacter sp. E3]